MNTTTPALDSITIEQLLSTVNELSTLADRAILNIKSVECKSVFLVKLDEIMDKHFALQCFANGKGDA